MLQFIQDNAVLCTCVVGVFTAILSAFVTLAVNRSTEKSKYINELKLDKKDLEEKLQKANKQLETTRTELNKYISIEQAEESIDKTTGSLYREKLPNGNERYICGLCWEKDHIKTPVVAKYYSDYAGDRYLGANCEICKGFCEHYH